MTLVQRLRAENARLTKERDDYSADIRRMCGTMTKEDLDADRDRLATLDRLSDELSRLRPIYEAARLRQLARRTFPAGDRRAIEAGIALEDAIETALAKEPVS
jgi:hypothetical protein